MSVTFKTSDTKYKKYQPEPEDDPEWWDTIPEEGYYDLNMANTNAQDLLLLLGRTKEIKELCGEWQGEELHTILRKVIHLKNIDSGSAFEKKPEQIGIIHECGRDSEYVRHRLDTMLKIIKGAIDRKVSVVFA
jgi:hypothetical protein